MSKIIQNPVIKSIIVFLKAIKLPGFRGFSIYDLFEMYFKGIIEGALSYRAGSIASVSYTHLTLPTTPYV